MMLDVLVPCCFAGKLGRRRARLRDVLLDSHAGLGKPHSSNNLEVPSVSIFSLKNPGGNSRS